VHRLTVADEPPRLLDWINYLSDSTYVGRLLRMTAGSLDRRFAADVARRRPRLITTLNERKAPTRHWVGAEGDVGLKDQQRLDGGADVLAGAIKLADRRQQRRDLRRSRLTGLVA
jgi:hypothetical protein